MNEHPNTFAFSVSRESFLLNFYYDILSAIAFKWNVIDTTRKPRDGEVDGVHYYFVERENMLEMIKNGEFVEHAEFGANIYGTSKRAIKDIEASGRICVLDLEIQGVRNMKALDYPAKFILIRAPSLDVLVSLF